MAVAEVSEGNTRVHVICEPLFRLLPQCRHTERTVGARDWKKLFEWRRELKESFDETKRLFARVNTLSFPSGTGLFIVEVVTSQRGFGAVLLQVQGKHERPIAYFSKAANDAQKLYDSHKLELYSLVLAVKHFMLYLAPQPFLVRTHNQAVTWWRSQTLVPGSIRNRWRAYLDEFDF